MREDLTTPPMATTVPEPRRTWLAPVVADLPKLTKLTLASAIGGGGGTGGGGSTVFGLLFALLAGGLMACSGESNTAPGDTPPQIVSQAISCQATVATGTVECEGPQATTEVMGGQGRLIALRSTNVSYNSGTGIFQFDATLQNLGTQTLGSDGLGQSVFFESGPTVTGGTGTASVANATGTATFSAPGQPYFLYTDSLKQGATSSAKLWQLNVPNTVTTFTFTVFVSTWIHDAGGTLVWSRVPGFSNETLTDLAVNSATDAMIVGQAGLVMRKVGTVWSSLPRPVTENWIGVEAIGGGKYVGATASGKIYVFDGKVWNLIQDLAYPLYSLTAYAEDRIAVGSDLAIDRLGNSGWTHIGYGSGAPFIFIGSYDADQGVAMAVDAHLVQFNFNGSGPVGGTAPTGINAFHSTVGKGFLYSYIDGGGLASLYDWHTGGQLLTNVADMSFDALSYGQSFTVWTAARTVSTGVTQLRRFSSGSWTTQATLAGTDTVTQLVEDGSGGMYLLANDGLRRWDGFTVTTEFDASDAGSPTAVSASGDIAWVGTSSGDVWRHEAGAWTTWDLGAFPITQISAGYAGDVSVVTSEGRVWIYDGSSWVDRDTWGGPIMGVASLAGGDAAIAGGLGGITGRLVVRFAGGGAASPDALGGTPYWRGIWGTTASNFWVIATNGEVNRFNGSGYDNFSIADTAHALTAITGVNGGEIWVADTLGGVLYYSSNTWHPCPGVAPSAIRQLWAYQPGKAYAVAGSAGGLYSVTTSGCTKRWIPIDSTAGQVTSITGTSGAQAWAIVGGNLYRGRR